MFGREHDQAGILVEPSQGHAIDLNDAKQLSEFRNKLWFVLHLVVAMRYLTFIQACHRRGQSNRTRYVP